MRGIRVEMGDQRKRRKPRKLRCSAWRWVFGAAMLIFALAGFSPARAADPMPCIVDGLLFDDCADSGIVLGEGPGGGGTGQTPQLPDLTSLGGFSFSPTSVEPGDDFNASVVIENFGAVVFGDNLVRIEFYLSPLGDDALLPGNLLGSVEIYFPRVESQFPDPSYVGVPVSGHLPSSIDPGQYRLAIRIDADGAIFESNEQNNQVAAGPTITVGGEPDLVPVSQSLEPTGAVPQGATVHLRAKIRNDGRAQIAGPVTIGVRFRAVAPGGDELGGVTLGSTHVVVASGTALAAGGERLTPLLSVPANLPPGTYSVALDVDTAGLVAEADEGNNAAFVGTFTVASAVSGKPDLNPKNPALKSTSPVVPGRQVLLSFDLANLGASAPGQSVQYTILLSRDTLFTLGTDLEPVIRDLATGSFSFGGLVPVPAAGAAPKRKHAFRWPQTLDAGTWHVGVVVNAGGAVNESNVNNNTLLLGTVEVQKPCGKYASLDQAKELFDAYYQSEEIDLYGTPGPRGEYCVATGSLEDDLIFFGVAEPTPPVDSCDFDTMYGRFEFSMLFFVLPLMHERCVLRLQDIPENDYVAYELLIGTIEDLARQLKKDLAEAKRACDAASLLHPAKAKRRRYCACTNPEFLEWETSGPQPGACTYAP